MKRIICALCLLFVFGATVAMAESEVEATGEGITKDQALTSAMRQAVEQGVGAYIQSSSVAIDMMLVEDKVLSHSKGYVTSYKVLKTAGGYEITISAKVDDKLLKDDIEALTILRKNVGNPRILVAFGKSADSSDEFQSRAFVDDVYGGIVEGLTDKQFRVVDKSAADRFAKEVAATQGIDVDLNKAAAYGLKYNAEYTLLYTFSGTIREGAVGSTVKMRVKTQLIDNTRAQVITSKAVESTSSAQTKGDALEKAARDGGRKVIAPMIEVVKKNWEDMQQNGFIYTLVLDGVDSPEEITQFAEMLENFPLVSSAREVESGGGKTTFEATYKDKRDLLDRDVIRATKELGWTVKKVRAEGAFSSWKRVKAAKPGSK